MTHAFHLPISAVEVYPLRAEVAEPFSASVAVGSHTHRTVFLVRVLATDGTEGWGETRGSLKSLAHVVRTALTPVIVGQDALATRDRWRELSRAARDLGDIGARALSAVDMALWDLRGRALGVPVAELLGGRAEGRFPAVATAVFYPPRKEDAGPRVDLARRYGDEGFRAIKMKIGGLSPAADLRHVAAIRDAIGETRMLAVDANTAYTMPLALRMAHGLADLQVHWFEEPLSLDDVAGYRALARSTGLVLAGGQNLPSAQAFVPLLAAQALHLVQPNAASAGGITGLERTVTVAQSFGVDYSPTGWGTGLLIAASLQLRAVARPLRPTLFPDLEWVECDVTDNPLREGILKSPVRPRDGFLDVPSGPGLGVEVDVEAVRAACVAGI